MGGIGPRRFGAHGIATARYGLKPRIVRLTPCPGASLAMVGARWERGGSAENRCAAKVRRPANR